MDYQHTEKLIIFSLPEFSLVDENGDDVGAGIMGYLSAMVEQFVTIISAITQLMPYVVNWDTTVI